MYAMDVDEKSPGPASIGADQNVTNLDRVINTIHKNLETFEDVLETLEPGSGKSEMIECAKLARLMFERNDGEGGEGEGGEGEARQGNKGRGRRRGKTHNNELNAIDLATRLQGLIGHRLFEKITESEETYVPDKKAKRTKPAFNTRLEEAFEEVKKAEGTEPQLQEAYIVIGIIIDMYIGFVDICMQAIETPKNLQEINNAPLTETLAGATNDKNRRIKCAKHTKLLWDVYLASVTFLKEFTPAEYKRLKLKSSSIIKKLDKLTILMIRTSGASTQLILHVQGVTKSRHDWTSLGLSSLSSILSDFIASSPDGQYNQFQQAISKMYSKEWGMSVKGTNLESEESGVQSIRDGFTERFKLLNNLLAAKRTEDFFPGSNTTDVISAIVDRSKDLSGRGDRDVVMTDEDEAKDIPMMTKEIIMAAQELDVELLTGLKEVQFTDTTTDLANNYLYLTEYDSKETGWGARFIGRCWILHRNGKSALRAMNGHLSNVWPLFPMLHQNCVNYPPFFAPTEEGALNLMWYMVIEDRYNDLLHNNITSKVRETPSINGKNAPKKRSGKVVADEYLYHFDKNVIKKVEALTESRESLKEVARAASVIAGTYIRNVQVNTKILYSDSTDILTKKQISAFIDFYERAMAYQTSFLEEAIEYTNKLLPDLKTTDHMVKALKKGKPLIKLMGTELQVLKYFPKNWGLSEPQEGWESSDECLWCGRPSEINKDPFRVGDLYIDMLPVDNIDLQKRKARNIYTTHTGQELVDKAIPGYPAETVDNNGQEEVKPHDHDAPIDPLPFQQRQKPYRFSESIDRNRKGQGTEDGTTTIEKVDRGLDPFGVEGGEDGSAQNDRPPATLLWLLEFVDELRLLDKNGTLVEPAVYTREDAALSSSAVKFARGESENQVMVIGR